MADDINKFMRDFNRYTGDGLPDEPINAPLPVGSAKSGPYVPTKADMRAWATAIQLETEAGSLLDAKITAEEAARIAADANVLSATSVVIGDAFPDLVFTNNVAGGAVALGASGLTIPTGQTGNSSFIQGRWTLPDLVKSGNTGRTLRVVLGFTTSATFTRSFNPLYFQVFAGGSAAVRAATITSKRDGDRLVYTADYVLQGDETALYPYLQIAGSPITSTAETITLTDFSYLWATSKSPSLTVLDEAISSRDAVVLASAKSASAISDGNALTDLTMSFNAVLGATVLGSYGLSIASGQTGNGSFIQGRWTVDGASKIGQKIRLAIGFDISATFSRVFNPLVFQVRLGATNATRTSSATTTIKRSGTRLIYTSEYVLQGDETGLWPYLQIAGAAVTSSVETISMTDFVVSYPNPVKDTLSANDEALARRIAAGAELPVAYGGIPALRHKARRTVAASGGDYTSPGVAVAAITDATAAKRYAVSVAAGTYEDAEWTDKDYVDFIGVSCDESIIKFHQPNDTTGALIEAKSAILMRHMSRLEGLKVTVQNGRYGIHLESNGLLPNRLQEIINCYVEHLGNDDAPANYWGAQYAIGSGVSSGQVIRIEGTTALSKRRGGFSYHTNVNFLAPSRVELIRSRFLARQEGLNSFEYKPLGSFQADTCYAEGCVFGGDIAMSPDPWLQTALAKQPADHNEITLTGHSNSATVFKNEDFGEALRIDSATTGTASSVVVSGTAAGVIFGDGTSLRKFDRVGSAGFTAAVWGWGDISTQGVGASKNVYTKTLGKRLGDCTTTAKTLSVVIDGGAAKTVTFNQNHTDQTNATVLGIINAALGAAGVASIFKPGARVRPMFADEERAPKNTSGSGIPMGAVLAYDGGFDRVRLMTSADAGSLFAGVAWEDIADNDRGRVKSRGYLPITDVLRSDSGTLTFGATMSVGATPGRVDAGGTQGLLKAIRNDAVEVKP